MPGLAIGLVNSDLPRTIQAIDEIVLRNAQLYAACRRVQAQQASLAWLLPVNEEALRLETRGEHVDLHMHRQPSRHKYCRVRSSIVLPAATLALSGGWCYTLRPVVVFPAQRLVAITAVVLMTFLSPLRANSTFAVLACTHVLFCGTIHFTRIDGLLPGFVWPLCP